MTVYYIYRNLSIRQGLQFINPSSWLDIKEKQ